MIIGANPTDGHPVFASRMKKRLREGAKLIILDPRRIDLVRTPHIEADYHLPLKPGTNVAVVTSLAHVIVTEGLVQREIRARALRLGRVPGLGGVRLRQAPQPRGGREAHRRARRVSSAARRGSMPPAATRAIYYGLGVTEHSQGSTTVMAIANLAMATGNIGREGVGVNPLRGQNNVQGSCDMGSFPHEVSGYRHVSEDATRAMFETLWGRPLDAEPGLRIPNMIDAALDGSFKGLYIQGEDILQSDPNTQHMAAGLAAMECVVVQDLFLVETAQLRACVPARLDLPGEERHLHQCRAAHPDGAQGDGAEERLRGLADHLAAVQRARLSDALQSPVARSWTRSRALTPTFAGVSYKKLDELGSVQWPCNEKAPEGTPIMHINGFVRGKGKFVITEYVATDEKTGPRYPLLLTTGRILSAVQCRRADAAHRQRGLA